MMPFDWFIPGRILHKDAHRPCIPTPMSTNPVLPAPLHLTHTAIDVPGAYGTTITDASSLGVGEVPARVLPDGSFRSAAEIGYGVTNHADAMLLDTRDVAWPEAPSISGVPFPVPTGPPSVAWQRNDYARGVYNTNTMPTSDKKGAVLPGPSLKTSN